MILLWVFFLSLSSCLQYVPLLREWENTDMNITNWMISNATYTDDSPFDAIELPFSFLFYDHKQTHVWISPNGFISFAPGVPCDCCYNGLNCDVQTKHYQALAGPYLTDLNPLYYNQSSILYGWSDNVFVVRWKDVPIYGDNTKRPDFEVLLYRDGSIEFHYYKLFLPLPSSYTQGDSIVGIRPFYYQGNITRRSPVVSTNQASWNTILEGNYATYDQLYLIENELNSTSTDHLSLSFCLMPTEFCVTPYRVSQSTMNITIRYSYLSCGDLSTLQFYCLFDNRTVEATLHSSEHSLTCMKPAYSTSNNTVSLQIGVMTDNDEMIIPTVTPMTLSVGEGVSSEYCDVDQTCSVCGICSNSTICLGEDDEVFGQHINDCPAGEIMDRGGECCSVEYIDCRGFCYGNYTEALDVSTGSYPVCCLNSTIDCHGVCGGSATVDSCGVCSNGFTGHAPNSDMDCMGVCFGNFTEKCDLTMVTDSLHIPIVFDVATEELSFSQYIFINNTSPYYGRLLSYPLIHNLVPPTLYYTVFLVNVTNPSILIPVDLDNFVFPGYATIAVLLSSSIQSLVYRAQQYDRSVKTTSISFVFQSTRPSYENQTNSFTFDIFYSTDNCNVIMNTRSCNLLPGCFGCMLNVEHYQHSNYFTKSFSAIQRKELVYKQTGVNHFFSCVNTFGRKNVSDICSGLVVETRNDPWILMKTNFVSSINDYYMIIVYGFMVIMIVIEVIDFVRIRRMRKFENELWELYLNDYAEYRSIVNSLQEDEEEEEEEETTE